MASSNRHWPSMFKSKPCNNHHHQWQHDMNSSLISNASHRSASTTSGCEEKSPEPKPRWNPRPEQIRILEAIFNSGMVNPPRDEIRKIRAQLQEYGQVGDANVFYWFQNRKSRSKHKQRQLQSKALTQHNPPNKQSIATTSIAPPSSSSSSSEKSSPNSADHKSFSICSKHVMDVTNSPTASSVNQTPLQTHGEFVPAETFFFPVQQTPPGATSTSFTQGFCFPDVSNPVSHVVDHQAVAACPSLFLSDLQAMDHALPKKVDHDDQNNKLQEQLIYPSTTAPSITPTIAPTTSVIPSTIYQVQGGGESGEMCATKSTVFINDVAFAVASGPFNVREAFGDDAVLIHSSGHPVLTNEWGVTLQPLQHGAFYFLLRTLTPSHDTTIDLI